MFQNARTLRLILVATLIQGFLISYAAQWKPSKDITIAIVNEDTDMEGDHCPYRPACGLTNMSCRFLVELNEVEKVYFDDLEAAQQAMKEEDVTGVIYFNEDYSDALIARMALGEDVADDETKESSEVKVWIDFTKKKLAKRLTRFLQSTYRESGIVLIRSCGLDRKIEDIPYQYSNETHRDFKDNRNIVRVSLVPVVSVDSIFQR